MQINFFAHHEFTISAAAALYSAVRRLCTCCIFSFFLLHMHLPINRGGFCWIFKYLQGELDWCYKQSQMVSFWWPPKSQNYGSGNRFYSTANTIISGHTKNRTFRSIIHLIDGDVHLNCNQSSGGGLNFYYLRTIIITTHTTLEPQHSPTFDDIVVWGEENAKN